MPAGKELIWVEKEYALKYQELEKDENKRAERIKSFEDYMQTVTEKSRSDFKLNFESLEEDVAMYKGLMLHVKQAFEKAKNEQLDASYELWKKFETEIPSIHKKTELIINELKPLKDELNEIDGLLKSIETYNMEKLIDFIKFFNSNVYGETENILKYLMDNYRKDQEVVKC